MERVCLTVCNIILTLIAAIKFQSHRDMAMPLFGIYTNITCFETGVEAVIHNSVPVTVTREHLSKTDRNNQSVNQSVNYPINQSINQSMSQ